MGVPTIYRYLVRYNKKSISNKGLALSPVNDFWLYALGGLARLESQVMLAV